jgi:hypothetical protein
MLYSGKRFRKALQHFLLGRVRRLFFCVNTLVSTYRLAITVLIWCYGAVEMLMPLSSLGMIEVCEDFAGIGGTRAPGLYPNC